MLCHQGGKLDVLDFLQEMFIALITGQIIFWLYGHVKEKSHLTDWIWIQNILTGVWIWLKNWYLLVGVWMWVDVQVDRKLGFVAPVGRLHDRCHVQLVRQRLGGQLLELSGSYQGSWCRLISWWRCPVACNTNQRLNQP